VRIAAEMTPGWHIGAPQPGVVGIPTKISWMLPEGWHLAEVNWPPPMRVLAGRDTLFEYRGSLALEAKVVTSRLQRTGTIKGTISYGICKDVCIPGWLTLSADAR
jgi:thiol:disulfide interchange protein DsbD